MKITFIIASLNDRESELNACIESIQKSYASSTNIEVEILCIFQNCNHENACSFKKDRLVTYYAISETGLSSARNYGIKRSTGTYLVFLDDDASVRKDFIEVLGKIIVRNNPDALCGSILDPVTLTCFSECFSGTESKQLRRCDYKYFMGSSHVLKKEVIVDLGMYDARFGVGGYFGGAEESDVFFRLLKRKYIVTYFSELVFLHPINAETSPEKILIYSSASSAALTKYLIKDMAHVYIYGMLLIEILFKSMVRSFQMMFMRHKLHEKNKRFQYLSVFRGTISGIIRSAKVYAKV